MTKFRRFLSSEVMKQQLLYPHKAVIINIIKIDRKHLTIML